MKCNFLLCFFLVGCCFLVQVQSYIHPGNTYSDCRKPLRWASCYGYTSIRGPRTIDGTCNNLHRKTQGAANTPVARVLRADYIDHYDLPRGFPGTKRYVPTAHEVSTTIFNVVRKNKQKLSGLSTIFMTFGQFLDHDMSISPHASCKKPNCNLKSSFKYPCFPILFKHNGKQCSGFGRAAAVCKGYRRKKVRQQINMISSYIDGGNIYSSDKAKARQLRKRDGSGELKTGDDNNLPIEFPASDPSCNNPGGCSMAGDARADENIALYSMHTIWLRHHNLLAKRLKEKHPRWKENRIFETARKINIGVLQNIVYREFVPKLARLNRYRGYKPGVNPSIFNSFSTAAYRFGHSLVPNEWAVLDENFDKIQEPISLRESFFNTKDIRDDGIEGLVFGLLGNQSQSVDTKFAHGLAKRLFVPPGKDEHADLTALNIQRGRDHGIPTYGAWRHECGLRPLRRSFKDLYGKMPRSTIQKFRKIYKHPNHIDLFAAGVAEYHRNGKILGPTFQCIIRKQFERLRDGDRFFYLNPRVFTVHRRNSIKKITLARVLCDTLKGIVSIQKYAFLTGINVRRNVCDSLPKLNMKLW